MRNNTGHWKAIQEFKINPSIAQILLSLINSNFFFLCYEIFSPLRFTQRHPQGHTCTFVYFLKFPAYTRMSYIHKTAVRRFIVCFLSEGSGRKQILPGSQNFMWGEQNYTQIYIYFSMDYEEKRHALYIVLKVF